MYAGPKTCPRCKGTHWHRDEKDSLPTGVLQTIMICTKCSEKLLVRHTKDQPEKCLVCRRWSLYSMGKLKPQYREWLKHEPEGVPVYKG